MNNAFKYWAREIIVVLTAALAIFFVLQFTLMKAEVVGESMEPSLVRGEQVMINKMAYTFGLPQRGDIIVFTPPESVGSTQNYIKRVIGLPGEQVSIYGGKVHITGNNGSVHVLDEPFVDKNPLHDYESGVIPEDHYFVMGDNRTNSSDSRGGWTVDVDDIIGKAWISFWPLSEFGGAPNYTFSD